MLRLAPLVVFASAIFCVLGGLTQCLADTPTATLLFESHCIGCHDGPDGEGQVDLSSGESRIADAELLRKLVHVLDTREMPPKDESQPSHELREGATSELRKALHLAVGESAGKRTPIRRMNRFQYNNAVVDLFQLTCTVFTLPERSMRIHRNYFQPASGKMPEKVMVGNRPLGKSQLIEPRLNGVAAFPQDLRAEHGYDTQADHLSLSPLLMESFLKLGQSITESPDFVPKRVGIWESFFAKPSEDIALEEVVRTRLKWFLGKAFRRPIYEQQLNRYSSFALSKIQQGNTFTDAMKSVAAATIASPKFLYLYDKQLSETEGRRYLDGFELASRMSFFLWGSVPDERLLELAAAGDLNDPTTIGAEIDRMLLDKKVKRFCDSFPLQWLQLDRIVSSVPNRQRFPNFYFSKYRLSMHMMLEPLLLFETVLIEDLPITQLIDPDFTYRSPKLEKSYGEPGTKPKKSTGGGVTVLSFHRTPIIDRRAGGVITNPAVMTMTSGPERTQPITRGAWIAGVVFNDPPEPPPADVPPLAEKPGVEEENLTLRERLAAHRERADCRGCHEQIDPLGFALENYDATGRWRDHYENGREIDTSGKLFQQYEFSNIAEFKNAILADKDRFCRSLAGHLLAFSLGRPLGPEDEIALDQITKNVAADDYKMKALIRQVILSNPFRTKS